MIITRPSSTYICAEQEQKSGKEPNPSEFEIVVLYVKYERSTVPGTVGTYVSGFALESLSVW